MTRHALVLGRFPPPIDGQTVATDRLASLLEPSAAVTRLSVTPQDVEHVRTDARLRLDRIRHYLGQRTTIRDTLATHPDATVFWTSISPMPLGHLRDRLVVLPAVHPTQAVYGVVHWGNFDRVFRHRLTAWSARRMVPRLTGLVFLNDRLAERCAPWVPAAKRIVIPNTIDDAVLCTDAEVAAKRDQRLAAAGRPLRLLFLSNMIPAKGYLDVLEAVRLLHARGVPVRADFAGGWMESADEDAFQQRVETYGLAPAVTHHGTVRDRARIKQLYLQADVFLLPTYYPTEAQPLSILEALNAGTPVITTRHAGIPEMVREQQEARFVPPRDPRAIAEAAEACTDADRWHQYAKQARRRFLTTFSPDAVRAQWLRLLHRPIDVNT